MSLTIKEAFEALSDACAKGMKNPFFVMRRLKDSFADVADKVVDDVYSTTEHVVGKWIDGSDVYEKVIDVGTLPSATSKSVPHNIDNLDNMISLLGAAKNSSGAHTATSLCGQPSQTTMTEEKV